MSFSVECFGSEAMDPLFRYCGDPDRLEKMSLFIDSIEESAAQPRVERIVVSKSKKNLYLIGEDVVIKKYKIALGSQPVGHKHFEGDGKTPEGLYSIDFKKDDSDYTKALHISYPNSADLDYAKSRGQDAGGDIMIHGFPVNILKRKWVEVKHPKNWTRGCVAVTNPQIEEIFDLVQENTLIEICPN